MYTSLAVMMDMCKVFWVVTGILLKFSCAAYYNTGIALTFELEDKEKTCFTETFPGGKRYVFSYQVIRGGNKDVDAWVVSPNGKVLYREQRKEGDEFIFDPSKGDFQFCFGNQFSTITHKLIFFDISPEDVETLAVEAGDKKPTVQTASEAACDEIHFAMSEVMENQRDYRLKEAIGRHLGENLNQRVWWWSLGQAFTVFIIGFGQVFILKTFFSERLPSQSTSIET